MKSIIQIFHPYLMTVTGLLNVFMAIWILFSKPRTLARFSFSGTALTIGGYLSGFGLMSFTNDQSLSFRIGWVAELCAHHILPLFYCFSVFFLGLKRQYRFASIAPLFGLVASFVVWNLPGHRVHNFWWGNANTVDPKLSVGLIYYFVHFFGFMLASFWNLISSLKRPDIDPSFRMQIRYLTLAFSIAYLGSLDHLHWLRIEAYPAGYISITCFTLIVTYTILRHRLLDITLFLKRISAVALIYFFLLVIAIGSSLLITRKIVEQNLLSPSIAVLCIGLTAGVFLSLGPIIYSYLIRRNFWLRTHASTGLAHELKSPLSAIQSAVAILEENAGLKRENSDEYIAMIKSNAHRLEGFVKDLLDVAKIQDGHVEPERSHCDLAEITRHLITDLQSTLMRKNLTIHITSPQNVAVFGDREKLKQTISNLISNAIKFSDNGKINITISEIANQVDFSVQDEGCGLNRDQLEKIFDRFYQARPGAKGSGLGLAIAKAWVEAHGGKIWVESEGEGRGTSLEFTLSL